MHLFRSSDLMAEVMGQLGALRIKPGVAVQREAGRSRVDLAPLPALVNAGLEDT